MKVLDLSMKNISDNGSGIIVYLRQEGRGIGLKHKIQAYKLQEVLLHKYNERGKEDGIINSRSNVSGHECVS